MQAGDHDLSRCVWCVCSWVCVCLLFCSCVCAFFPGEEGGEPPSVWSLCAFFSWGGGGGLLVFGRRMPFFPGGRGVEGGAS